MWYSSGWVLLGAEGSLSWLQSNFQLRRVSPPWAMNTPGQEGACTECSWTCTWVLQEPNCVSCAEMGAAGFQGCPKPSAAFLGSGWGLWRQQGHSWSATALSRFAEHGVSGMCWVPTCRTGGTGRINSLFTGVFILLQVNSVEKLSCSCQWEEPAESLPHNKPFPALQRAAASKPQSAFSISIIFPSCCFKTYPSSATRLSSEMKNHDLM